MYIETFQQMKKHLGQLDRWLGAAEDYAKSKNFDANVFVTQRLAPDMFPLARQVQICCDSAKLAASYLSGKPAESQPDTEATIPELRTRVRSIATYLDGFTAADFAAAATKVVSQPRWKGEWLTGQEYLLQHALPNFFFHLTTTYAILRHGGVGIGKKDFLGPQDKKPAAA
ncbi:MAG TPA: DUF1993 domain-containing protein [Steroidobacteraceae bacterium]|nr:DUF1993 domain-containing protein [Steroidobacteraceae bacterium]